MISMRSISGMPSLPHAGPMITTRRPLECPRPRCDHGRMVTVLTVIGSPNPRSFAHALAHEVGEALQSRGADVEEHDLYAEQFQPVAPAGEALTTGLDVEAAVAAATDPVVRRHRHALSAADYLVVAHPNWWGKPPAVMAGWMDRVLVPGVAYRLDTRDGLPTSLLRLRGVLVLNTGDTPPQREREIFGDPLDAIWRRCVGAYLGSCPVHRLLAGPLGGSSPEQRRAWLAEARAATAAWQW